MPTADHIREVFEQYCAFVSAGDSEATFDASGLIASMRAYWSDDCIVKEAVGDSSG